MIKILAEDRALQDMNIPDIVTYLERSDIWNRTHYPNSRLIAFEGPKDHHAPPTILPPPPHNHPPHPTPRTPHAPHFPPPTPTIPPAPPLHHTRSAPPPTLR